MRIIPGDHPDVWFESGDLTSGSIIVIRRESVTCCGFLGGDSIYIISSGSVCGDLLMQFRPVLPWNQRIDTPAHSCSELESRTAQVLTALTDLDRKENKEPAADISAWQGLFTYISDMIWFAGFYDPYRFNLAVTGDIRTFLTDLVYPARLLSCLHWWFQNEATEEERREYVIIPLIDCLNWPEHHEYIVRAINLYNHGTYEVANR